MPLIHSIEALRMPQHGPSYGYPDVVDPFAEARGDSPFSHQPRVDDDEKPKPKGQLRAAAGSKEKRRRQPSTHRSPVETSTFLTQGDDESGRTSRLTCSPSPYEMDRNSHHHHDPFHHKGKGPVNPEHSHSSLSFEGRNSGPPDIAFASRKRQPGKVSSLVVATKRDRKTLRFVAGRTQSASVESTPRAMALVPFGSTAPPILTLPPIRFKSDPQATEVLKPQEWIPCKPDIASRFYSNRLTSGRKLDKLQLTPMQRAAAKGFLSNPKPAHRVVMGQPHTVSLEPVNWNASASARLQSDRITRTLMSLLDPFY